MKVVNWPWKKTLFKDSPLGIAERLRMVLEELGPTFIKFGQILSTRPDLLSESYISQLSLLQDQAVPAPFAEIDRTLESELGTPPGQNFKIFSQIPIASASIGQVYEAYLMTGEHVIVKVQRVGLDRVIETDLEIMYDLGRFLEARTEWGRLYKVQHFIDEFARTIRDELDYINEAKNAERFRENFRGDSTVYFPKVYWEFTTRRVLVLEYVEGIKITDTAKLDAMGINKVEATRKIANAFFKQLLIDGFFHADPHPGNLMISPNQVILFMDFGMVGRVEGWLKEQLGAILLGAIRQDLHGIIRVLQEFGNNLTKIQQQALKRELYYLLDKYQNRPLKEIKLGAVFQDLLKLSFHYQIRIPQELALLGRCLILLENVVEQLDPKSSVIDLARPFGPKLLLEKLAPQNLIKLIANYLFDWFTVIGGIPGKMNHLLQIANDGELKIVLEHQNFENLLDRLTVLGNSLSISLIIAGTIIASALVALKTPLSFPAHFPIAETGFILALVMGLWLLFSIMKTKK
jgi:ubiquinone biosynthesis protein